MNMELIHKPRPENLVPDALSRKEEHISLNVLISLRADAQVAGLSNFDKDVLKAYKSNSTAQELNAMFDYCPIPRHGLSSKFRRLRRIMRNTLGFLFYDSTCMYLPPNGDLRKQVFYEFHDAPIAGHQGPDVTIKAISKKYY